LDLFAYGELMDDWMDAYESISKYGFKKERGFSYPRNSNSNGGLESPPSFI